jgi:hypothetical protein
MSALNYVVEPEVDCSDDDLNDAAFVRAASTIGGRDVVEEFVACKMYLLASSFSFKGVTLDMTLVSKVRTPLPVFLVEGFCGECPPHFGGSGDGGWKDPW